ncbi:MAG: DUF11 domain-containing protein [Anaerolineae bacterium]|nr:DUF11 domain-containing protein [Anaerolineae bacterium]
MWCGGKATWRLARPGWVLLGVLAWLLGGQAGQAAQPFPGSEYIIKTVDRPVAGVGDVLTYTITFRNPGSQFLVQVVVTDTFDARLDDIRVISEALGTTIIRGKTITVQEITLAPGQSASLTVQATVSQRARTGDLILNSATLESPEVSVNFSNQVVTSVITDGVASPRDQGGLSVLLWNAMPLVVVASMLGLLVVSLRTRRRLRRRS